MAGSGGQRGEAFERAGDGGAPGPVGGQVQREPAGVAGQAAGDMQQAVAQSLGLAGGVVAVEEQQLGPDGEVVRAQRGFQPCLVGRERRERQVAEPGALEFADAVFDDRVGAVAGLQGSQIMVVLVGDKALKAVPVDVGERELGAGMRGRPTFCVSAVLV
jgi:hypothetical protein